MFKKHLSRQEALHKTCTGRFGGGPPGWSDRGFGETEQEPL